jgi:DNA mismatch repair protein MutL
MSPEDAALCLERHATSKLARIDDLNHIQSFGFRGEALPSIASVSRLRLRTRRKEDDAATEINVEAGRASEARPSGAPPGTLIEVRDLFYNVPARRKFLRSSSTESGHISDVVDAAALGHPEVTFRLHRDGRPVRTWLRARSREERTTQYLDEPGLASIRAERGPLSFEAYLSRPERARAGAGGLRLFVNGRPVKDRALAVSVAQAYGSVLERGRYPRGVVFVDVEPSLVDVNVHPQKTEVRFADPGAVTRSVHQVLSQELAKAFSLPIGTSNHPVDTHPRHSGMYRQRTWSPAPSPRTAGASDAISTGVASTERAPSLERPESSGEPPHTLRSSGSSHPPKEGPRSTEAALRDAAASLEALARSGGDFDGATWPEAGMSDPNGNAPTDPAALAQSESFANLRFIAQVRKTYLLCESSDGIYVLDQHAAAERVTFDRLRRQFKSRQLASQNLLFPAVIEATPEEVSWVEDNADLLSRLGLGVDVRGEDRLSVHGVPKLLSRGDPEQLVRDLLSEGTRQGGRAFSDAIDLRLATMACHGSVRAGDVLGPEEARALLVALDQVDFAGHCPHGRPVVTVLTYAELERKVGRR